MRWVLSICVAVLALVVPGAALAAPPVNDDFGFATTIASLPASETVDLTEATFEGGEPSGGCWAPSRTSWYSFQPSANLVVRLTTSGSYDRVVNVYRDNGSGLGGLGFVTCGYTWSETLVTLEAGATYYLQVGAPGWSPAGDVTLQLMAIDPPPNDDFANSSAVGSLPYSSTVDMRGATTETGEPTQPSGVYQPFTGTAWYAFTPADDSSVMVTLGGCCASIQTTAVFTGGSVDALTEVPVTRTYNGVVFNVWAGMTYMIQSGVNSVYGPGQFGLTIQQTPPPSVGMWWFPGDPSSFDTIGFQASAYDPAGIGIDTYGWDFGDGTVATGTNPTHRYTEDGDYSVTLTVTTPDGRTAADTRTVSVVTRDVAITKLSAPQSARSGQTRTLTVGVANRRAAESVTVALYRSRPGGSWDLVGQSTQQVPARTGNRTTPFVFSYTFTPDDASIGKVTFRAVATINNGRDALPADNEAIAPPTIVG